MVPLSDNARGAVYMMVSMAGYVSNDTLVKLVSTELSLMPTVFLRGLFVTFLLVGLAHQRGVLWPEMAGQDRRLILLRMAAEIGATLCFLTALFNMPIANATAILQAMPLAVTLAAAMVLREQVGWRRYTAIAVGFIGVLVIVQPGSEGFTTYSLWAIGSVGFMVVRDLSTRGMAMSVPPIFVALTTCFGITVIAGVGSMVQPWGTVSATGITYLGVASLALIVAHLTNVLAMRHGEIGFVSPFRYSVLLWAILLGWLVFGDVPSAAMLIGSAIVVATGVYTLYRERQSRRRAAAMRPFGAV